jgi:pyruvate/2-oxoglutarate dehydrogenase complex dihydrolipoamide dehydrogenase (E3) component
VGLTEAQAKDTFGEKRIQTALQYGSDRSMCEGYDSQHVLMKIVYHAKSQQILGATIMSPAAGETISELGVALKAKMKFSELATVMHSYPSHAFGLQVMASEQYYANLVKYKGVLNLLKKVGL